MAQIKDAEIDALSARLAEMEALRTTLAERETEIRRLEDESRSESHHRTIEIEYMKRRIDELEQLRGALSEREIEITRLEAACSAMEQEKATEIHSLQTRLKEIAPLKTAVQEREVEVQEWRRHAADLDLRVSERDERIGALEQQLAAATARKPQGKRRKKRTLFKASEVKDDLKTIYGIGPVLEKTLNRLGITSYAQVARFTRKDIDRVAAAFNSFPDRIVRDDWVGGAKREYQKKYGKKNRRR
jgi:predicted flap endonuclease-1-like 5' DNA nuclease